MDAELELSFNFNATLAAKGRVLGAECLVLGALVLGAGT